MAHRGVSPVSIERATIGFGLTNKKANWYFWQTAKWLEMMKPRLGSVFYQRWPKGVTMKKIMAHRFWVPQCVGELPQFWVACHFSPYTGYCGICQPCIVTKVHWHLESLNGRLNHGSWSEGAGVIWPHWLESKFQISMTKSSKNLSKIYVWFAVMIWHQYRKTTRIIWWSLVYQQPWCHLWCLHGNLLVLKTMVMDPFIQRWSQVNI